ncbi:MAG: LytTR family transcriptional regulator [Paludibacteraceae bacterium]
MNTKIPAYLYEKSNIIRLILFTASFALLFINIFQPFNSRNWYPYISDFKYFLFSSFIILTGMLVVVVSRLIMFFYTKKHTISYWSFVVWILAEVFTMSLFYSLFTKFIPREGMGRDFMDIMHQSVINTSLVLLLPYSILWLYFSWREKNNIIQHIEQKEIVADSQIKNLIAFPDEKGELKISVTIENLLYIDSADNYVTVHYLNKSRISHYLIRNSLKWMEERLQKKHR